MPYDQTDLRSQLAGPGAPARTAGATTPPQYFEFGTLDPDEVSDRGSPSWHVRSQSCCLSFTQAEAGDELARHDQPDEYMVLLPSPDSSASVVAGDARTEIAGRAVVVVPPGRSVVTVGKAGTVVRLFTTLADDLTARCRNADVYAEPDPNVAPFQPWPDPPAGHRVRVYRLDDIAPDPARFGRLLRCSTLMVNYFESHDDPRDPSALSPHHHDDFEQLSLQLAGDYVHHMRTPWTVDMANWRDDEHRFCSSPAVTIIPPPIVHTTQALGHMTHQLIDIFSPPRLDFSLRPGWILNHDDYPMP
jgi:hypothetical protein